MRFLSRCSEIIVANINALLDTAENPEAVRVIAAERLLNRELTEQRNDIEFVADPSAGGGGCRPRLRRAQIRTSLQPLG